MKDLDAMVKYLKEAIEYTTASDIYELPREEFTPYVSRCKPYVVTAAIPHVVLFMLEEERNSTTYKIKRFFQWTK